MVVLRYYSRNGKLRVLGGKTFQRASSRYPGHSYKTSYVNLDYLKSLTSFQALSYPEGKDVTAKLMKALVIQEIGKEREINVETAKALLKTLSRGNLEPLPLNTREGAADQTGPSESASRKEERAL